MNGIVPIITEIELQVADFLDSWGNGKHPDIVALGICWKDEKPGPVWIITQSGFHHNLAIREGHLNLSAVGFLAF